MSRPPLLSITEHAIDRFRERVNAPWMSDEAARDFLTRRVMDAIRADNLHPGLHVDQAVVRLVYRGIEVCVVVGWDRRRIARCGYLVITVLTAGQVAAPRGRGGEVAA